ncbi:MAG: hypothetical protein IJ663_02755 [Spirochaetales bacterium]|nr:hypothetical protein [Spirochaetales bacterium]
MKQDNLTMLDISHNNKEKKNVFHVIIYSKENGDTPFRDYLLSLSPKMKTKVLRAIEQTDKTPRKEIEKAERYRADWIRRNQR